MSKKLKKESTPLKFDISSQNLNCFILAKSKSKSGERDSSPRRNRSKRKMKANKEKHIEFQQNVFLQSVVSKILNDADCEGITKLIDQMVFPATSNGSLEVIVDGPLEELERREMNQIFSDLPHPNRMDRFPYNNIYDQHHALYQMFAAQMDRRQQKQDCMTTVHSSIQNSMVYNSPLRGMESNPEIEMVNAMNQAMAMGYAYNYCPYLYQRVSPRKRSKNNTGQQNQQFKITPLNINEDGRTTLMIRHIPNKYSEEMLLEQIGKNHKVKINFLYLPIDNFNSCNVGYAFVNFMHTKFILDFYDQFNGRRWNKFNSQKICQLAYARIQGTTSLMDHFQNSNGGQPKGRIFTPAGPVMAGRGQEQSLQSHR